MHHFTYSAFLVCAGSAGSRAVLESRHSESIHYGTGLSLSAGLLKEIRDMRRPGNHFCWKDVTANLLGTAFGVWIMASWR